MTSWTKPLLLVHVAVDLNDALPPIHARGNASRPIRRNPRSSTVAARTLGKRFRDRPPRVGAEFAGVDVTITVKPLGPEESHGPAAVSHQYRVDDDQGNKLGDALTIANGAFREWESLLDRLGLPH